MRVDLSLIGGVSGTLAPAARLRLNLFLETDVVAVLHRFEQTGSGYAWVGKIEGEPLTDVVIVTVDGTVSGTVRTAGRTYAIRATDGVGTVSEVEERLLPRGRDDAIEAPPEPALPELGDALSDATADDGALIDIAVVYSPTALRAAASEAALRADIDLAVARTNQAFSNSGVRTRLRQVHTGRIDYEDSGDKEVDLERVTNGAIAGVHHMRDSTGADLVALITGNHHPEPGYCGGIAWINPTSATGTYGYSVTEGDCLPYLVFAHEIGHNLGAQHDWFVDSDGGAYTFSHGHVEPQYRMQTVMAYFDLCEALNTECDPIAWFSNPRVHFQGTNRPIGVAAGTDTSCREGDVNHYRCDADNVRTFNEMARVVARFRRSKTTRVPGRTSPPTLDFTCHGYVESGTNAYNCIPAPEQQHHMRTFVPPPGSPCNQGSVQEFPPGRVVFQIRCRAGGAATFSSGYDSYGGFGAILADIGAAQQRTTPATLDFTCHGYVESGTNAYNCIPAPEQQHHMRTFVPPPGSPCNQGSVQEFPPGRFVFQIRCQG